MTAPSLDAALRQLDLAYGKLTLPDWQAHAEALADAVGGLTELFLHVDATTGQHHVEPIYLDRERVVIGMIPAVVAPLIDLLDRQTQLIDLALENGWSLPNAETNAWAHWHLRLARYKVALARELAHPHTPSEDLWRDVTAPLIQGIYPRDFDQIGIVNTKVASKPDVSTVATTAFMVALQSKEVGRVQAWLLSWREDLSLWIRETGDAIRAALSSAVATVRTGARRAVGIFAVLALVGGLTWAGLRLSRSAKNSQPPTQEQS